MQLDLRPLEFGGTGFNARPRPGKKKSISKTLQKGSMTTEGDRVERKLHFHKQWGSGGRGVLQEADMAT